MTDTPIITKEVAPIPRRRDDAHKGDVGRIAVVGGCCGDVMMLGAATLTANAALRAGAGLVQMIVPAELRTSAAVLAPCTTLCSLPTDVDDLIIALSRFRTDVLAIGPGLGDSLTPATAAAVIERFPGPVVVDADGLNLLSAAPPTEFPNPSRVVMTPHPGELRRLLDARGVDLAMGTSAKSRREAASALVEAYGCVAVVKGHGTVVACRERIYVNQTGNAGMATGGAGDVLTGIIAALIGQGVDPFEAAILGVYLHGLAGDFAAEELGRWSVTATDILDYLPEAFCEHDTSAST